MTINQNHLGIGFISLMKFLFGISCFRIYLLNNVYYLLADLIEWSDKLLFSKTNNDDKYRKIAKDLMQAVKVK